MHVYIYTIVMTTLSHSMHAMILLSCKMLLDLPRHTSCHVRTERMRNAFNEFISVLSRQVFFICMMKRSRVLFSYVIDQHSELFEWLCAVRCLHSTSMRTDFSGDGTGQAHQIVFDLLLNVYSQNLQQCPLLRS